MNKNKIKTYLMESANYKTELAHIADKMELVPIKLLGNVDQRELIEYMDLDINNFYKVINKQYPYCYINKTVFLGIYGINEEVFEKLKVKETILKMEKIHKELIKNNDYEQLFTWIEKPFRFEWYKKLFDKIPNNQKYEIFKDIYSSSEYGFSNLSREFLNKVFSYNTSEKEWFDKDIITIYRGEGSKSAPYTRAYSWTTDINIAKFFATRYDKEGKIYKGKVRREDILDFLDRRSESEVLIYPENVFDITRL